MRITCGDFVTCLVCGRVWQHGNVYSFVQLHASHAPMALLDHRNAVWGLENPILTSLRRRANTTVRELVDLSGYSESMVRRHLQALICDGRVVVYGDRPRRYFPND